MITSSKEFEKNDVAGGFWAQEAPWINNRDHQFFLTVIVGVFQLKVGDISADLTGLPIRYEAVRIPG